MVDSPAVDALAELLTFLNASYTRLEQAVHMAAQKNRADAASQFERQDVKKVLNQSAQRWDELANKLASQFTRAADAGVFAAASEHRPDAPSVPEPVPQYGDAVRLASPWKWGAWGVRVGAIGILDGPAFEGAGPTHVRIVFNGSGPATIATPVAELLATTETHAVWRARATRVNDWFAAPGQISPVAEQVIVPLWDWHPTE